MTIKVLVRKPVEVPLIVNDKFLPLRDENLDWEKFDDLIDELYGVIDAAHLSPENDDIIEVTDENGKLLMQW